MVPTWSEVQEELVKVSEFFGCIPPNISESFNCFYTAYGNRISFSRDLPAYYGFDWRFVLAHEVWHSVQYARKDLVASQGDWGYECYWKGEYFPHMNGHSQSEHEALPWEIEANQMASTYLDYAQQKETAA